MPTMDPAPADARRAAAQLAQLRRIAERLAHRRSVEEVATLLVQALCEALEAAWVALYRLAPDGALVRRAIAGTPGHGQLPEVVDAAAADVFPDDWREPVLRVEEGARGGFFADATLLAAVDDASGRLGVLAVGPRRGAAFDDGDAEFAGLLAFFAAPHIAYADVVAAYRQAMLVDPATGFGNRRAYEERVEEELARANRTAQPLALLLCELDGYARWAPALGAAALARVLHQVADAINRSIRRSDNVYMVDPGRIALLLTNTDGTGALVAADRLRRSIARIPRDDLDRDLGPEPLRVSIGTAALRAGVHKPISLAALALQRKADEALYRARREAGDRGGAG